MRAAARPRRASSSSVSSPIPIDEPVTGRASKEEKVLLSLGDRLGNDEIMRIQAPPRVAPRVLVAHRDETISPPARKDCRALVDAQRKVPVGVVEGENSPMEPSINSDRSGRFLG